jgi:NarL family two-component system response regulator LiaR
MPPSPRPLRVAVVNDYDVVVRSITAMLAEHRDRLEVMHLVDRPPGAPAVDIVLLDTFARLTPDRARLGRLAGTHGAKVVVFAWSHDHRAVRAALDAGVAGYVSKSLSPTALLEALEAVRAGETVVRIGAPDDADAAGGWSRWPGREHGLSPLEAEVMALIAQGLTNREVGVTLFLGVSSVKSCIRAAYRKTGVAGRSQAMTWALDHGFVPQRALS